MIRKYICLLLCAVLLMASVPVFASGGSGASGDGGAPAVLRIGVSTWKTTDIEGASCKKVLDDAARALGVKIIYAEHGGDPLKAAQTPELLCDAGCKAIVFCSTSDEDLQAALDVCEERKIPMVEACRILSENTSPELYRKAAESDIFIGNVTDEMTGMQVSFSRTKPATLLKAFLLAYNAAEGNIEEEAADADEPFRIITVPESEDVSTLTEDDIRKMAEKGV